MTFSVKVLDLNVHLVIFWAGWVKGIILLLELFYQSTPLWLKVIGGCGGLCDSSVSPLDLTLDFGLGLDNSCLKY